MEEGRTTELVPAISAGLQALYPAPYSSSWRRLRFSRKMPKGMWAPPLNFLKQAAEIWTHSGRRITSNGQRDLDRIAGTIKVVKTI